MGLGTVTAGSSVIRRIAPISELVDDPRVAAMLEPIVGGVLPAPLRPRADHSGIRVASMNLRMFVPERLGFDQANESYLAMRDIARLVKAVDPDILLVQELRARPVEAAIRGGGIGDAPSAFAHLIDATDMAFTPAITQDPFTTPHQFYGTAIYTRNDATIDHAFNMRLTTTSDSSIELRSAGFAEIDMHDARGKVIAGGLHVANEPYSDMLLRMAQVNQIGHTMDDIHRTGRVSYVDAITGQRMVSEEFSRAPRFIAGDFNQTQAPTDRGLKKFGFVHVNDVVAAKGPAQAERARLASKGTAPVDVSKQPTAKPGDRHGIDHGYVNGIDVDDVAIARVPRVELPEFSSDHEIVVFDLAARARA